MALFSSLSVSGSDTGLGLGKSGVYLDFITGGSLGGNLALRFCGKAAKACLSMGSNMSEHLESSTFVAVRLSLRLGKNM